MEPLKKKDIRFVYNEVGFSPDYFPTARYYAATYNYPPSVKLIKEDILTDTLLKTCLHEFGAEKIHYSMVIRHGKECINSYVLGFPNHPGYLLEAGNMEDADVRRFMLPVAFSQEDIPSLGEFSFITPPETSDLYDAQFEEQMGNMMKRIKLEKRERTPKINIIESFRGGFKLSENAVNDSFHIQDLDINYGPGFEQFHNDLIERFNTTNKGLVLFHGPPGTGKTYYIRHLLRQMAIAKKSVIYIPPNMVNYLTDPMFMSFLGQCVRDLSKGGTYCILLIEDAEPLLVKREDGVRIQGVTNLLNMTDGLLNDMLKLQIICTFNVAANKLDSALLRPGRLLARKEFKPLSELDANILAQRLGINHHFRKPVSLSEIYSMLGNQDTLFHDVDADEEACSEVDDLI